MNQDNTAIEIHVEILRNDEAKKPQKRAKVDKKK